MTIVDDLLSIRPKLKPDQLFFSTDEKNRMVEVVFQRPITTLLDIPANHALETFVKLLPHHRKIRRRERDDELWTKIRMELPRRRASIVFRDIAILHLIDRYLPHQIGQLVLHPRETITHPSRTLVKGLHLSTLFTLATLIRHLKGV